MARIQTAIEAVPKNRKTARLEEPRTTIPKGSEVILDSSMVEHPAVNRRVVGSSPTRGVAGGDAFRGNTRSHFEHDG